MRSFAEQMLHLATEMPDWFLLVRVQNILSLHRILKITCSPKQRFVVYYVNTSYEFAIHAIQNMDLNKLTEVVTWNLPMGKRSETRLAWLLKAFEHQTHHRGQCTVYLRLLGIKPPYEKLF
jgi:uncharacterized damage-inducible protein DinB